MNCPELLDDLVRYNYFKIESIKVILQDLAMSDANSQKLPAPEELSVPKEPLSNDSVKGFEWWRRTMQYKTGLGLTLELAKQYENDALFKHNQAQCEKCDEDKDWILRYSPTVRFMAEQINKLNPTSTADVELTSFDSSKIICEVCPEWKSGGFHPKYGILLCQNRLRDRSHLEDTLAHEMIHYYDNLKWQVDWLNLKHHACSEIRASSLSGECRFFQEFSRRGFGFTIARGHQECVKRRAIISVMGNPNCKDREEAEKVVNQVWDSCFYDTRPFEKIYR